MHMKTLFIDAIIGLLDDCYIFLWFLSNKYLLNNECTSKRRHLKRCLLFLYNNNTIKLRWFKSEKGTFGCLFFVEFA
ncbi:hypothetical protein COL28_29905 [Bacillus thuringiensis]|nr:hypothetical protein COM94_17955 [Bacillus thuringiensis]PEV49870.1 hypothetical protein CN421_05380 [Bacillus thuringiensis]PFN46127.1 hypothetical protein COJ56_01170 [Bacillus thuringiensis]PFW34578.1 hypothetical protein COL28_29905 [Bacillus thuringiensis]PGK89685.1 hypothetical protein CN911_28840 [Bacillus thuringiensis]